MMRALVLSLLFANPLAHAQGGSGEVGGGGNDLVANFVAYASNLFARYQNWEPGEKALLQRTLRESKIITVKTLRYPTTQEVIPEEVQSKLIAWGSPGLIQLKLKQANGDASWEEAVHNSNLFGHQIVHELYRASGLKEADGKTMDDAYQISVTKLHLNEFPLSMKVRPTECTYQIARHTIGDMWTAEFDSNVREAMKERGYTENAYSSNQLSAYEENCHNAGRSANPFRRASGTGWIEKCDLVLVLKDRDENILDLGRGINKSLADHSTDSQGEVQIQTPPRGMKKAKARAFRNAILNFNPCR